MKRTSIIGYIAPGAILLASLTTTEIVRAQKPRPPVRFAARSAFIDFLLTPRGLRMLRGSQTPMAAVLLKMAGEPAPVVSEGSPPPQLAPDSLEPPQPAATGCGTASGTRFNLEARTPPGALPQDETALDFLPGAGFSGGDLVIGGANDFRGFFGALGNSATGYYVHRNGASANPCSPDFEGGLPPVTNKTTGEQLLGGGDAAVEADPTRGAVFMADTRIGQTASAIGIARSSAATLNNPAACPSGTHTLAQAQTCWPKTAEVNPRTDGSLVLKPHLAVDPRATGSGTGAGDVYVVMTLDGAAGDNIVISACRNDLSACSTGVTVSGAESAAQLAHVRIRPDVATHPNNSVTITYINITGNSSGVQPVQINYVTCTPAGAPSAPTCAAPRLIATETQPIPANANGTAGAPLTAAQFHFGTYPKHEHRQDANGVETYVVWDRCAVVPPNVVFSIVCPNADVLMSASSDNGRTWHSGVVDSGAGDQYFPWISADSATNKLNIVYYSTEADRAHHRPQVLLRQIAPGASTPDPVGAPQVITATPWEPAADFFLGDAFIGLNIGVASRHAASGSRAYVHFTHNIVPGQYNGAPSPEQNNHLSRFDY